MENGSHPVIHQTCLKLPPLVVVGGGGGDNPPDAPGASSSLPSDYMPDGGLKFK